MRPALLVLNVRVYVSVFDSVQVASVFSTCLRSSSKKLSRSCPSRRSCSSRMCRTLSMRQTDTSHILSRLKTVTGAWRCRCTQAPHVLRMQLFCLTNLLMQSQKHDSPTAGCGPAWNTGGHPVSLPACVFHPHRRLIEDGLALLREPAFAAIEQVCVYVCVCARCTLVCSRLPEHARPCPVQRYLLLAVHVTA